MFWKRKDEKPVDEPTPVEKPVEYTPDGCTINKYGFRQLMITPKGINYNDINVSINAVTVLYNTFSQKGMVGCMVGGFSDEQTGNYKFDIVPVQNAINYAVAATIKLDYLKKECVERGIAHYNSSGEFTLNDKIPENPVDTKPKM